LHLRFYHPFKVNAAQELWENSIQIQGQEGFSGMARDFND
jgi:hypothetical protein